MMDLKDINYQPTIEEIKAYIGNEIFKQFLTYMNEEYKALCKIEYSKDVYFKGWNVKFRKAGKGLCVIYPKEGYFTVLVVIGSKEQDKFNDLYPALSKEMKEIYDNTKEGNNQRWLMIDINKKNELYDDVLKLIQIRRESK